MDAIILEINTTTEGNLPEWIELLPSDITGRDGRSWLADHTQVLNTFKQRNVDIPIDIEHASQLKAPKGEAAPSVGWIKALKIENNAIWGRVVWNDLGKELVASKQYRYLSPAITFNKQTRVVTGIQTVGITNQPNLHLQALNKEHKEHQEEKQPNKEPENMSFKNIAVSLNLEQAADESTIIQSIQQLQTKDVDLNQYVPKADHELALNKQKELQEKLNTIEQDKHNQAVEVAINQAITAGKIAPASKGFYEDSCQDEEGLNRFKQHIESLPSINEGGATGSQPKDQAQALNAQEQEIAQMMGVDETELQAFKSPNQSPNQSPSQSNNQTQTGVK